MDESPHHPPLEEDWIAPDQDGSRGEAGSSDPNQSQPAFWCYQCNKEVIAVEAAATAAAGGGGGGGGGGTEGEVMCSECHSGFLESMATAQTWTGLRHRRQAGRQRAGSGYGQANTASARSEASENDYPDHLLQLLELFGLPTLSNDESLASLLSGSQESRQTVPQNQLPVVERTSSQEHQSDMLSDSSFLIRVGNSEGVSDELDEVSSSTGVYARTLDFSETDLTSNGVGSSAREDGRDQEEEGSDSDTARSGLRVQVDGWGFEEEQDDEDWDEFADDSEEVEAAGRDEQISSGEASSASHEGSVNQQSRRGRARPSREVRRLNLRARNAGQNLQQYLQQLLSNLVGNNVAVRVELPEGPLYVGNPGDYLDSRGFEQLLLQLAENDSSRRGAPPAAKSAVESLPWVTVEQKHMDDESAVCAVCKEVIPLGEQAKQLPCLHLYHEDCILPWLSCRNSCPVCRYELPTDDPDYEEQKQGPSIGAISRRLLSQAEGGNAISEEASQQGDSEAREEAAVATPEAQREESELYERSSAVSPEVGASDLHDVQDQAGVAQGNEDNRGQASGGRRRGWLLLAAGPVLSMVGLVLVLCIGNHLISGPLHQEGRELRRRQHGLFSEQHIEQLGIGNESQGRRRWWLPFQW